jgi:uncharacterized membrane protein
MTFGVAKEMRGVQVAESAVCAALYAVTGYIMYLFLPITTPGVGIVRFWPNVVVPAIFAVLFGPLVGAIGASVGIFISDVLIHGDPLLSLCVGVTSNFVGFYLIGYVSRKNVDWTKLLALSSMIVMAVSLGSLVTVSYVTIPQIIENRLMNPVDFEALMGGINPIVNGLNLFNGVMIGAFFVALATMYFRPEWRNYQAGSVVGLGVGSAIVGFGVWAYSQIFFLPAAVGGGFQLPLYASLLWLLWTFATEIPFLVIFGPPLLAACYKAFPSLSRPERSDTS